MNRGGGILAIKACNATPDDGLAESAVTASLDAAKRPMQAGDGVRLE